MAAFIRILVEDPSTAAAIRVLVPKILGEEGNWLCIEHRCKSELIEKLPRLMRGYRNSLATGEKIIVVVDADRDDCMQLKARLEDCALQAGLPTRESPECVRRVFVRIAVEELEAWFFGDWKAVRQAYPKVSKNTPKKSGFRNPDQIRGGTKEALDRILKKAGYHRTGVPRIDASRRIAEFMDPDRNTSRSFCLFRDTLRKLAGC